MGSNNSAKLDDPVATALGSDTDSSRLGTVKDVWKMGFSPFASEEQRPINGAQKDYVASMTQA